MGPMTRRTSGLLSAVVVVGALNSAIAAEPAPANEVPDKSETRQHWQTITQIVSPRITTEFVENAPVLFDNPDPIAFTPDGIGRSLDIRTLNDTMSWCHAQFRGGDRVAAVKARLLAAVPKDNGVERLLAADAASACDAASAQLTLYGAKHGLDTTHNLELRFTGLACLLGRTRACTSFVEALQTGRGVDADPDEAAKLLTAVCGLKPDLGVCP